MVTARLRGTKTTTSPLREANCEAPESRTVASLPEGERRFELVSGPASGLESGLIHAVMVPSVVAACTALATRVRQMLPPLDSTFMGPETYMMRMPPPA